MLVIKGIIYLSLILKRLYKKLGYKCICKGLEVLGSCKLFGKFYCS